MKKFGHLIHMTFLKKFAYMKAFWFNIAGTAAAIFIYYFLWKFVFQKQESLAGFTMPEMTAYVIVARMLSSQFGGGINMEFAEWVYEGNIAVELLRPVSLFFTLFAKRVGEFFFFVLFKGIPITVLCTLLLKSAPPQSAEGLLLFVVSVCISIGIMFFMEFFVGLCSFYTYGYWGLALTKSALLTILSGGIVPLALMPDWLGGFLDYMPFAGMVSVPANIYLGKYGVSQALQFMGLQVVWVLVLYCGVRLFYSHVIKKVVVQGG